MKVQFRSGGQHLPSVEEIVQPHVRLGFTIANIDEVFSKYAKKTYNTLLRGGKSDEEAIVIIKDILFKKIKSLQYKIECVNNANG